MHSYSAGVVKRVAQVAAIVPFEQAAAQVSAAGAITIGKRQAEELAVGAVADSGAFYAARRPGLCPAGTGLLITADGSAFPVLPGALRPATAQAERVVTYPLWREHSKHQKPACATPNGGDRLRAPLCPPLSFDRQMRDTQHKRQ